MSLRRPEAPSPWPVSNPTTAAGKKAAELHADWVKQFAWVESVEADHAKARAAKDDALEALRAATTPKAQGAAEAKLAEAEKTLAGPWMARLDGPIRAAGIARSTFMDHVDSHLEELIEEPELADAADAAPERVLAAIERLIAEVGNWQDQRNAYAELVRLAPQLRPTALPDLSGPVGELERAARKVLADPRSVPAPKPDRSHLQQRAVDRGEADWVGAGEGGAVQFVRHN
jgi:hypothetical protein